MTDPHIIAQWNKLREAVEQAARRALSNPEEAAQHGLYPLPLREHGYLVSEAEISPWLRAAAHALIPPCFEWELVSVLGGEAFLLLQRYRDDLAPTTHPSPPSPFGERDGGYPRNLD